MKLAIFFMIIITITVLLPIILVFYPALMVPVLLVLFLTLFSLGILWIIRSLVVKDTKQIIISLPFIVVMGFIVFIGYHINLHHLFLKYVGLDYSFAFTEYSLDFIFKTINPWLPIAIIISVFPTIIFSGKLLSGSKPIHMNQISNAYYMESATIIGLKKTNIRIRKVFLYEVQLSINSSDSKTLIKKVKFSPHLTPYLQVGKKVTVYLNDNQQSMFYIKIGEYLY